MPMFAAMAGIYIHIPFCRKACHYCNFHFSTSFQKREEMNVAMLKEIELQRGYLKDQAIETIYFGGGTPSAIPAEEIEAIIQKIRASFAVVSNAEITLEANPDDMTKENLEQWKARGINRLSIGIQAFQDDLLTAWNRSHSAAQALQAISLVQEVGIDNITADLIYGGAGLTDDLWVSNIQRLLDTGIPHISSYALTVEPGTALSHFIKKGTATPPDDDQAARQYGILQQMLSDHGFMQYEVSNFAKPGNESRHNTSYWSGAHYLGIGPSAHSFNGHSRQWNVANNIKYIDSLQGGNVPFEKEELGLKERYNEIVMTGLRTSSGIDMKRLTELGDEYVDYLNQQIKPFVVAGKIFLNDQGNWTLKPEYYFFADGMAAEMFVGD